jgi:predicted kinase
MNKKKMYIFMGIPGAGKSTTAGKFAPAENIFETDQFFIKDGKYTFNPEKIGFAHFWNTKRAYDAVAKGKTPIVIANTNTTPRERKPYIEMAEKYGYDWEIVFPESPWFKEIHPRLRDKTFTDKDVETFYNKNTHGVPFESIKKMMSRWTE